VATVDKSGTVKLQELLVTSLAQTDAVAKLLIEKGVFTQDMLGSSFHSVQSLGWKMKEDCVVSEVEITSVDVAQHTLRVLISYLREYRPGRSSGP